MTILKDAAQARAAYAGIIFDFNGVLLWDADLQERAWLDFSRKLRGTPFSTDEMIQIMHGRTNSYILEYLIGHPLKEKELQELTERKEDTYRRLCLDQGDAFRLAPGAVELLEHLKRRGIPRTIATSSPKINLDFFIDHLELYRWFEPTAIAYDDGTFPGKPAPDIYVRAAANIGLDPSDCVVIEDAISGIEAARRAGIGRVYALGPSQRHGALRGLAGVEAVISQLDELPTSLFKK